MAAAQESWTVLRVLDWTCGRFGSAGIEPARLEAQVLLAHALACDRVQLYVQFDKPLGAPELSRFRELVRRRLAGEPVAYLVGGQEFWSLPVAVDPRVLVPRRETETVVEVVLETVVDRTAAVRIADVGTGSGALAFALAHELPAAALVATDRSSAALVVAVDNATRLDPRDQVGFRLGDLLAPMAADERFDVIVANLPYVRSAEIATLAREVQREPRTALDGGADGLDLIRRLVAAAPAHLVAGGLLALEHGHDQGDAVRALFATGGAFEPATTRADLAGHPRVTAARRRGA